MERTYEARTEQIEALAKKRSKQIYNVVGDVALTLFYGGLLLWLENEYGLNTVFKHAAGAAVFLIVCMLAFVGFLVWRVLRWRQCTAKLERLKQSYLTVSDTGLHGFSFSAPNAEGQDVRIPISEIKEAKRLSGELNVAVCTKTGEYRFLELGYAADAVWRINELCGASSAPNPAGSGKAAAQAGGPERPPAPVRYAADASGSGRVCPNCGALSDDRFCSVCGTRIDGPQ